MSKNVNVSNNEYCPYGQQPKSVYLPNRQAQVEMPTPPPLNPFYQPKMFPNGLPPRPTTNQNRPPPPQMQSSKKPSRSSIKQAPRPPSTNSQREINPSPRPQQNHHRSNSISRPVLRRDGKVTTTTTTSSKRRSASVDASSTTVKWRHELRVVPDAYPIEIEGSVFLVGIYNGSHIPMIYTTRRWPRHIVVRELGDHRYGIIGPQRAAWLAFQLHSDYADKTDVIWNARVCFGVLPAPRHVYEISDPQRRHEAVKAFWAIRENDNQVAWFNKPVILPSWFNTVCSPVYSSDESSEAEEDDDRKSRDDDESVCNVDDDDSECNVDDDRESNDDDENESCEDKNREKGARVKKSVRKAKAKTLGSINSAKAFYDDDDTIDLLTDDPFNEKNNSDDE